MKKTILFVSLLYLASSLARTCVVNKTNSPSGTEMVLVGDAHNEPDELGQGSCEINFSMGVYEWTVTDWKVMLDDVAAKVDPLYLVADPHQLWNDEMKRWIIRKGTTANGYHYDIVPGTENLPITHVNFFDICRACNYMQNKGKLPLPEGESFDSITEHSAYEITVHANHSQTVEVAASARYFIPTQQQWIKAAYYKSGSTDAGYWMYPTQHDNNPGDRQGPIKENRANYNLYCWDPFAPALKLSPVNYCGRFDDQGNALGTLSAYGCFDMAGNVNEWTATQVDSTKDFIVMGGDYTSEYYMEPGVNRRDQRMNDHLIRTSPPQHFDPNTRSDFIGFRMAAAADMANTIFTENSFPERNESFSWNNLTTGEQAAEIAATAGIFTFGAAIEAIAGIEAASLKTASLEIERLERLEQLKAEEFIRIMETEIYADMKALVGGPSIKYLTEGEKSYAWLAWEERQRYRSGVEKYTVEIAKEELGRANAPNGYIAREAQRSKQLPLLYRYSN